MNKHTPWPWSQGKLLVTATTKKWTQEQRDRADKSERLQVFANFLCSDEGKCRKHVATCHSEADARLIAAAPELLEALKSAREYIDNCGAQAGVSKAISDIEKAITKAEGGAS